MIDLNHSRNLAVCPRAGCFHVLFLLPALMAGMGLMPAGQVMAQTFTTLHSFTWGDGAYPLAGLILSSNTLYGTASVGGTVFAINTDGTGFIVLLNFGDYPAFDPANPSAGLILSNNTLYGTTGSGGSSGLGTVFKVNTDGTGFTTLHSFAATPPIPPYTNSDGAFPVAGLILSSNVLYGTAEWGGSYGNGTVFSIFIQPQLTINPVGQSVILSWSTNYDSFTLQSTTNLNSAVWTTNPSAPIVVNELNTVTKPISATREFYRLSN